MTRRTAIATVAGTAALVATEFALGKRFSAVKTALGPQRPKSNILLITFDALSAEDMSLYGYKLPTTPNIDAFARKGTVFTNFYSASTFTTPSVATMVTGVYPSECGVYQLQGQVRAENAGKSLPHAMRAAGYASGAFVSNPVAYYLATGLENAYDLLPEPTFLKGGLQHLWEVTSPLHQDSGFGCRSDEYSDLENVWNFLSRDASHSGVSVPGGREFRAHAGNARQIARWIFPVGPRDDAAQPLSSRCCRTGDVSCLTTNSEPLKGNRDRLAATLPAQPAEPGGPASPALRRVHRNCRPCLRRLYGGTGKRRKIAEHDGHRVG